MFLNVQKGMKLKYRKHTGTSEIDKSILAALVKSIVYVISYCFVFFVISVQNVIKGIKMKY